MIEQINDIKTQINQLIDEMGTAYSPFKDQLQNVNSTLDNIMEQAEAIEMLKNPKVQEVYYTIVRFLAANEKINAIKYVREFTGWGLKEAKDFVDNIAGACQTRQPNGSITYFDRLMNERYTQ